jgi:anti-sigma regulatory factor (Ser/Thr protein kinase)
VSLPAGSEPRADDVAFSVPADAASLATVRLFAASLGSTFGVAPDEIDDLKLVLSELCAAAVHGSEIFEVRVGPVDGRLRFLCRGAGPTSGPDTDRRRGMLEALIPDAVYTADSVSFALDL